MPRTSRPRRGLLSWLANAAIPVFVLNQRGVVLFYNRGCQELTGWTAADMIGQTCRYSTGGDPDSVAALTGRLCPPPGTLERPATDVPAEILDRQGVAHLCTIHYFVLRGTDDLTAHIVGLIGPPRPDGQAAPAARPHFELAKLFSETQRRYGDDTLIGVSPAARRLREQAQVAAGCNANIHIQGQRGVGRERLARLIHARSLRRDRAFVPVDCARIPAIELKLTLKRLLAEDSQLEDDAFRAGTVFLRQVGDLPRDVQELLLPRQLNRPVGGWQLISADERPLHQLLDEQRLLPDFVEFLSEFSLTIPPLCARPADLPLIAQDILESLNRDDDRQIGGFAREVSELFARYDWPGNIAELAAVIRESRDACTTPLVTPQDLPFRFRTGLDAQATGPALAPAPVDLEAVLARVEADHIRWALSAAKSNKSQAAALLGLTRPRLYRRMEALAIADDEGQA